MTANSKAARPAKGGSAKAGAKGAGKKAPLTAPPAGENKPAGKSIARKRSPQIAREMLIVEMRRIRSLFVEIGERYLADTEGSIVALIGELDQRKLPMPSVDRLLKDVRSLSVKPRKGRRKDLARIEMLVDAFRKTLED